MIPLPEAACWAHARRKIHDVHVRTPSALTEEALRQIGQLYAIEADIKGMPAEQRLAERQRSVRCLSQGPRASFCAVSRALSGVQTVYCVRDESAENGIGAQGIRILRGASLRTGEAVRRKRQ